MPFDKTSGKHRAMRDLLRELGVPNPDNDNFYSIGSTVTTESIRTALIALRGLKTQIRSVGKQMIDIAGEENREGKN